MFKSEAQKRRLKSLVDEGKFPQAEYDKLEKATGMTALPERVGPKKKRPKGGLTEVK